MAKQGKSKSNSTKQASKIANQVSSYPWLSNTKLHRLFLFFICFILYANTLTHDYTLDDAIVIYDNEFTTQGFSGIDDLLKYDTFRGFFKVEGKESLVAGGRYRPLTPILFAVFYQFFGNNPWWGHALNVLLYAFTCLLLYQVFLRLLSADGKTEKAGNYAYFVAFFTALLFAVHPLHTEVVANIKGADEITTLLGSLAAMHFSMQAYFDKKKMGYLWAGLIFFLALMAKENAITFIAVVPMTYFFFTKAKPSEILKLTLPFLLAGITFIALRFYVLGFITSEESRELMNNPFLKLVGNQYVDFTLGEKFATIFYTLGKYLQLLIFPHPLSHDYYPRAIGIMSFSDWRVILSVLIYVAMGVYALIRLPKRDVISYGILFYLGNLFLTSNILFSVGTTMNERFVFISSIGFTLIVAILSYRFANRMTVAKKLKEPNQMKTVLGILGLVIVLFSIKTIARNFVWKDNYTLFTTDVKTTPNSAKLRNSAAGAMIERSTELKNDAEKKQLLTEAVSHLQEAIKIHPGYKNAYLLMGNAQNYLQQFDASVQSYQQALKLDPNYTEAEGNLAITYQQGGKYFGEQKNDLNKAMIYLKKAYEMRPNEYETVRLLGVAHGMSGQTQKAIDLFAKATQLRPNDADAWYNLGSAYFQTGDQATAQQYINKALEINPKIQEERARR